LECRVYFKPPGELERERILKTEIPGPLFLERVPYFNFHFSVSLIKNFSLSISPINFAKLSHLSRLLRGGSGEEPISLEGNRCRLSFKNDQELEKRSVREESI
jgi:hypothetical protein